MSGLVVVVSQTGCSSGPWRYGHMSTVSTRGVRAVTLLPSLGGSLATWPIAIILMPVERIRSTGGASLTTGSCPM
ncbi:hypothetical protein JCGZ_05243 [Jatropha curcas]|uniref:Uncharacterized protein n=1 Tax=Jatropha curcas TaxID=180498 RepID=A0A067KS14_JATCU|nr:hypothetical protein JCGZ_05243 [Jatropha curcas]